PRYFGIHCRSAAICPAIKEVVHCLDRSPAHFGMTSLFVVPQLSPHFLIERWQEIEGYVRRLKMVRISVRDVVAQTPQCRFTRKRFGFVALYQRRRVPPRDETRPDGFRIPFHSRNLSGEKDSRISFQLQRRIQKRG